MSPALRAAEPLATAPSDGRGGKACRRCQDDADLLIVQTSMEFSQTSNVRVFGNDTDLLVQLIHYCGVWTTTLLNIIREYVAKHVTCLLGSDETMGSYYIKDEESSKRFLALGCFYQVQGWLGNNNLIATKFKVIVSRI